MSSSELTPRSYRDEPLRQIIADLARALAAGAATIEIAVLDPDHGRGHFAGERVVVDGVAYVHRPYRTWVDLAERLGLRLRTPRLDGALTRLTFERLVRTRAESTTDVDVTERYGADGERATASKLEDPGFVIDLGDALARCALADDARVLSLGVNTGDELALLGHHHPALAATGRFVGIDHSASAIAVARARFPDERYTFLEADLRAPLPVSGAFDLVIAIATLQSSGLDDRDLLRRIVQEHLAPAGAVILGVPNCRYVDGEVEHGARMKNFRQPELGLLVKDVAYYRKYLQQHHRQVFVTGKHYVLVTGTCARDA